MLIVEDDVTLRSVLLLVMTEEGFACDTAGNGEDGLEQLRRGDYDLVLTDMRMPKLSGLQMIQAARQSGLASEARFILLSGYHDYPDDELRRAGVAVVLHKPVALAQLLSHALALLEPHAAWSAPSGSPAQA
jgi:DNA-binding response OmpR family regulator